MLQAQANINNARQADDEEHMISKDDDLHAQLMDEARAAMRERVVWQWQCSMLTREVFFRQSKDALSPQNS